MHRFFVENENINDDLIEIKGEDVKHIRNVLRLEVDDEIEVCDKLGTDYRCRIDKIDKEAIECLILKQEKSKGESPIEIVLYQGLPKSTKMELIVQKATELGVKKIVPLVTSRSIVKINDRKKEEKKIERWVKIAEEAAKQSKRGMIPQISSLMTFDEMVKEVKFHTTIVPYENEENTGIKSILKDCKAEKINIIIGPEGGFGDDEIDLLKNSDAHIVTLGPRILRTETAGFTTTAIVLYELGDLGVV